jgi:hypothetical protein
LHPAAVVDEPLQRNRRVGALAAPAQGRVPHLCRSDALSLARAPRAARSASMSPSSANRHPWSSFGSQTSLPGSYLAPRGRSTLENVLFEKLGVERIGSAAREVAARPDCPCR